MFDRTDMGDCGPITWTTPTPTASKTAPITSVVVTYVI